MRTLLILLVSVAFVPRKADCDSLMDIQYVSSADETKQSAMFYAPDTVDAVPLVVALHTWSGNYKQNFHSAIAQWCMKNGWAYIHPDFRGPNTRPEATGSELVVKDIVSAVEYAKKTTRIDSSAIYLVGSSGGGYTALVMAGHHPEIWAGVSAWVPISDLKAWYDQGRYRSSVVASCGGVPGDSDAVDEQYRKRSPLTYLANAKGVKLHINAGINDGHTGSVPISHSLLAFNEVAAPKDRLSKEDIRFFVEKAEVPPHLKVQISAPSYGKKQPLFRRTSGTATVVIFNGGHELVANAAISWIQTVHKTREKADEADGK
ncbi:MAG: prolyl oligopeptidase family serine peptidase [Lentisphaeria bacterium]|nr:prolyl oligopeptidase family serine peptidase [Lentisphaeria bacterium]